MQNLEFGSGWLAQEFDVFCFCYDFTLQRTKCQIQILAKKCLILIWKILAIAHKYLFVVEDGGAEGQKFSALICLAFDHDNLTRLGSGHVVYFEGDADACAHLTVVNHRSERREVIRECRDRAAMKRPHEVAVLLMHYIAKDNSDSIVTIERNLRMDVCEP